MISHPVSRDCRYEPPWFKTKSLSVESETVLPVCLSAQFCLAAFILLLVSDWWMVSLLYAGWLWLDWDTPSNGGRRSQWVRSWAVWGHFRDYFPLKLIKTVDLDPTKNYIFGFHPHGEKLLSINLSHRCVSVFNLLHRCVTVCL
uniref:Uncharacterized protein n=1 Tax=Oryzias sinensis TaxID=183150 RepID=A0A8C8DMX4_9TELE